MLRNGSGKSQHRAALLHNLVGEEDTVALELSAALDEANLSSWPRQMQRAAAMGCQRLQTRQCP